MAAKRLRDVSDEDPDYPDGGKRISRLPSFSTVIREAMMMKTVQNFVFMLEPVLRKVVQEEMERGLIHRSHFLERPNHLQIEAPQPTSLKLIFKRPLSLPIFTGSKIKDEENKPIQILIVRADNESVPLSLPYPLKLEVIVVDGDFPLGDHEDWTSDEFKRLIVKERKGKRPLITGDVNLTLRGGSVSISNLSFTDNSSWIRSRQFRIAVRIVPGSYDGERIRGAVTEPFMVKDHRGELYRKHYPPAPTDEVWRLENIGKDGAFHKKLSAENINTVQDFLKLWAVDAERLRKILGRSMSDCMWEGTINHAKSCEIGSKLYLHRTPQCDIVLDSICRVVEVSISGTPCAFQDLKLQQKEYMQQLARQAYQNWDGLQETDRLLAPSTLTIQSYPQIADNEFEEFPQPQIQQENAALEYQLGGYDEYFSPDQSFYGQ